MYKTKKTYCTNFEETCTMTFWHLTFTCMKFVPRLTSITVCREVLRFVPRMSLCDFFNSGGLVEVRPPESTCVFFVGAGAVVVCLT